MIIIITLTILLNTKFLYNSSYLAISNYLIIHRNIDDLSSAAWASGFESFGMFIDAPSAELMSTIGNCDCFFRLEANWAINFK